ncbi:hypothetical protein BSZ39_10445 [Bowdeniella nasicola]|uniref:Uncharacterized protein n=1 Tax=Bowdeniella nasicola TaxID=208480 RepID=A0A1Q5Q0M5_9ACTO|nr:hypothetical protein [Bowdeniella nasicola]OKL53265.1 hypothetical protein BSZ39_10445 [Bowdeniella nasicola]
MTDFSPRLASVSTAFEMSAPLVLDGGLGPEVTVTASFEAPRSKTFTAAFTGGALTIDDEPAPVVGVALTSVGSLEHEDPAIIVPLADLDLPDGFTLPEPASLPGALSAAHTYVRQLDEAQMLDLMRRAFGWLFA